MAPLHLAFSRTSPDAMICAQTSYNCHTPHKVGRPQKPRAKGVLDDGDCGQ